MTEAAGLLFQAGMKGLAGGAGQDQWLRRALGERGEQLCPGMRDRPEPGPARVLGAIVSNPERSICQGSGDSGRMAGSLLSGMCGSPWPSGQLSPARQPAKLSEQLGPELCPSSWKPLGAPRLSTVGQRVCEGSLGMV